MGFITDDVLQKRRNHLQKAADDKDLEETRCRQLIEETAREKETELQMAIREFCSADSLGAIRHVVRETVVEKFVRDGYVGWVTFFWDLPDVLIHDKACTNALLVHLRAHEPRVKEVVLTKTAFHKYPDGKPAITVYFENGLLPD